MRTPEATRRSILDNANLATGRLWGDEKIPILEIDPGDGSALVFLLKERIASGMPMKYTEGDSTEKGNIFYRCSSLDEAEQLAARIVEIKAGKSDQYQHTA